MAIVTASNTVQIGRANTDKVSCGSAISVNNIQVTDNNGHSSYGKPIGAIVAGTGAGTSPTISVSGSDQAGTLTLTTGTACAANATIATIYFGATWGSAPVVHLRGANALAASLLTTEIPFVSNPAATSYFVIKSNGVALANSSAYVFTYHCLN